MRRIPWTSLRALLVAVTLAGVPWVAVASDKFVKNESVKIDPGRKPTPGKALIYFVRTQTLGAANKVKLYADGNFLSVVASKTFVPYECEPGKHSFAAVAENAGLLDAEVAADKIYVVQVAIHMGAMKARTHFEVARPGSEALEEFLKEKSGLRGIDNTDEGRKWVEEEVAQDKERMEKYRQKGEVETLKPEDGSGALPE